VGTKQQILKVIEELPDDAAVKAALNGFTCFIKSREAFSKRTVVS